MATRAKKPVDFEAALGELETLVTAMEEGELSLEDSLAAFEKGIQLTRECQTLLTQAEQRVQLLLEKNGTLSTPPFDADDADA